MDGFRDWLFFIEGRQTIDPAIIQQLDRAFGDGLEGLIQRTPANAPLRKSLEGMRQCPIKTASGCTGWTDYIIGGLLRNCPRTVDLDSSLNYIAFRMLSPVGERGEPRKPLFSMDVERDYNFTVGNPLEARFKTFLMHDLRSVCGGKVRRLMATTRPPGTVSITQGHRWADQASGTATADEIPDRSDTEYEALLRDIMDLLARQTTPDLPLLDVFQSMLRGENLRSLRTRIGHTRADRTKKAVHQVIEDYATKTGNLALQNLLKRFRENKRDPTAPRSRFREKQPKPLANLSPDVRDYISILQVVQAAGGAASSALIGKKRSRWYERKPRDPASPHKTRLHDVLARMVEDGVLEKRGTKYLLGPNAPQYLDLWRQATAAVPVGA